jgi:hypothetical protein
LADPTICKAEEDIRKIKAVFDHIGWKRKQLPFSGLSIIIE